MEQELSGFQQRGNPVWGYVYDGLGRRVEKLENGAVVAVYLRNALGEMWGELDGTALTGPILGPKDGAHIAAILPDGWLPLFRIGSRATPPWHWLRGPAMQYARGTARRP